MKFYLNNKGLPFKGLFAMGLMMASFSSIGQDKAAVLADAKLGVLALTDYAGYSLSANNLQAEQLVKLKVPVIIDNHGKALPAGSCKIKIGLGSKLLLDPGFDLNNAGLSNYFRWTASENGGQLEVTGELVNTLPANINTADLSFRVKVAAEGNSAITANFLISNHNTAAVLSDENGANNASVVAYRVEKKLPTDPSTTNGNLKLAVFPNPAKAIKAVNISVLQGKLVGTYKISLYDLAGKLIQVKELKLNLVSSFTYDLANLSAGQYLIKVLNVNGTESSVLKFEKL